MLSELVLDVPAEPFSLARRLKARDSVSLFWGRAGRAAFLCCDPVEHSAALDPEPGLTCAPSAAAAAVPRWVGLLPYECRRDLERGGHGATRAEPHVSEPRWLRYGAVAVIDPSGVRVIGDDAARVRELAALLQKPGTASEVELSARSAFEARALHEARIARALEHIRAGDLYQVNLARRFEFNVRGAPWDLLARLSERGLSPFAAAFSWADLDLVSLSPELFLKLDTSGAAFTSPIKGTRPRGVTPERDAQLMLELDRDPKERAELTMVLDVERNDLARVSVPGSIELVEPPHVETHGTVHHRVATLRSQLKPQLTRREVLSWMLPSGSVTGAPKVRAMDLIAELEAERRGLYTGALGYIAHDGGMELSMAIRTLTVKNGI
ncbi:MAG TPA: anthranilate synthase component I family protein, partial [Polyangiaceae bacterium]|nr:anthranilate synthase component I family protein [Polyangiaceae bacterium]